MSSPPAAVPELGKTTPTPARLFGIPLVLWSRGDPRPRLTLVIVSLQVLGQTVLGFKVSIAQILITVGVCAAIEILVAAWRQKALVWPASALLTGNSIAFILRTNGTRHGDWWSFNGIEYFVIAAVLAMLSKLLLRPGGRHIYNPSNLALVTCLLWFGPSVVYPQYLWWGPIGPPVLAALVVIVLGGIWVLRPLRLLPMVAVFCAVFWCLIAGLAALGPCFVAIWQAAPVCGSDYWFAIALSPELLVFVFFMMSDPQTAPRTDGGRRLYAIAVAVAAALLIAFEPFEFGIKVALLAGLAIVLPLVSSIDSRFTHQPAAGRRAQAGAAANLALAAAIILSFSIPIGVVALSLDEDAINRDRVEIASTLPNPQ